MAGRRRGVDEVRTLLGQATPCVGREQELEVLGAAFEGCIGDATAGVMLVLAPSGMGKSRLRQEFLLRLSRQPRPIEVLLGYGEPRRANIAYGVLAQAVLELCGIRPGGDPVEDRRRLAERVGQHVEAAARQEVVEFVGELCGLPFPDEENPRLHAARQDPRLMNERITQAVATWLQKECAVHPVLLVLEDLHWGDAATVRLIDAVLEALAEEPLWVLVLARPEIKELFPTLWSGRRLQELRLGGLGRKASERLAREVLHARVPDALIERIVQRAQGHALFLEELIRAAAEGAVDELPETVAAMLQARFARFGENARRVLWAASLFGETFWRGGVAAVLGLDGGAASQEVEAGLAALVQAEVVTRKPRLKSRFAGDEEFVFRHALVRDAAYALLSEELLRTGHGRVGWYLEQRGEPSARTVAEHYERGGMHERAVMFFVQAAWQANERIDYQCVLECVARGVACGATGEALGQLRALEAAVEMFRWNFATVVAASQQALELLPPGHEGWYRAVLAQLGMAASLGQREVIQALATACIDNPARPGEQRRFMEAAVLACMGAAMQGLRELWGRLHERIEDISARHGAKEVRAQGLRWLSFVWPRMLLEGDAWRHLLAADAGLVCFETVGDQLYTAALYAHRGLTLGQIGQREPAMTAFQTAVDILLRIKDVSVLLVTHAFQALVLAESDRPEDLALAQTLTERILAQNPAPTSWNALAAAALSGALLGQGQLQAAENAARQALAMAVAGPVLRPLALALLARSLLAQGRASEARAVAEEGLERLSEQGGTCFMDIKVLLVAAEARHATGAHEDAHQILARAQALLEQRATQMDDEQDRQGFFERVKDHARVRELSGISS